LADGGYVVAWTSDGQDKSGLGVYAQRYDNKAKRSGLEFLVNTTTAGNQSAPAVAGTQAGGFVIGWQAPDGDGLGTFAQRYDATGKKTGKQFAVKRTTAKDQWLATAAGLEDGGFVLVWQSNLQDGAGLGVYGQRYQAAGGKAGNEFRI